MSRKNTTAEHDPALADALSTLARELEQLPSDETSLIYPYVAAPVDEALRQRLQQFLLLNPELDQEEAWCRLLNLGLQKAAELRSRK